LPGNRSELIELVSRNTPAVTGYLLEPLASFLTIGRRIAGDDADKVLIMLVITLRATRSPEFQALDREQIESGEVPVLPSLGVNISSLAASTGIPKETVRRKVRQLIEAGWIAREGRNLLYTAEGYRAVSPCREALVRMAVTGYQVVSRLQDEAG
jgi:hypothetical protein